MQTTIKGAPSFSHVHVDLSPGESVYCERGAMQAMSANVVLKSQTNGGFFSALIKKFLGGESFFITKFTNNSPGEQRVTFSQTQPGEIIEYKLDDDQVIHLKKGAYIAATENVKFKVAYAGFGSLIAGEGLVRLKVTGKGILWFGGYGRVLEKDIDGELVIDSGYLLAHKGKLKLNVGMVGGIISSITSKEGFITRVKGEGTVYIQTRSVRGLAAWLNSKFR
ncbi:MAG: TIGR00266 family protein [Bacteroidales bacterium]